MSPPHEGAFAFLRLKLNDLVHTLGGFLGGKINLKNTYSWKMCVSYTKITGNVKSKHKQYDHWHSQVFSTGGQSEGAERPSWGNGGGIFCTLIFFV